MPYNMVNFGPLATEICWRVWITPANFNGFHVLVALLHGILVEGVSQPYQRWTEGATYIWQGGHHVGHWPTFLVIPDSCCCFVIGCLYFSLRMIVFCQPYNKAINTSCHVVCRLLDYRQKYCKSLSGIFVSLSSKLPRRKTPEKNSHKVE